MTGYLAAEPASLATPNQALRDSKAPKTAWADQTIPRLEANGHVSNQSQNSVEVGFFMVVPMSLFSQGADGRSGWARRFQNEKSWPRGEPLRLSQVKLSRGSTEILHGIDLTFEPGKRYVIVGASGSGKSTLLRLLNRLEDPTSGEVRIGDHPLTEFPIWLVRRSIGMVFQTPRPLPGSVRENLLYPWMLKKLSTPADATLVENLEHVGLKGITLDRDAASLSGGERQRLLIAVALQARPEILALDEPTASLDPEMARTVAHSLQRLSQETGIRTIAVCHQPDLAPLLGETVIVMKEGRVVDQGPIGLVLEKQQTEWLERASSERTTGANS